MMIVLTAVGVISGVSLVFVYNYSAPKIEANIKNETKKAIQNIFPEGVNIEEIKAGSIFGVKDSGGKLLGYALMARASGYQGEIKLIAGTDQALGEIKGIEVIESQETPGLGDKIKEEDFRKQFRGLSLARDIEYVKGQKPSQNYQIESITGATISSRAVVGAINNAVKEARETIKGVK